MADALGRLRERPLGGGEAGVEVGTGPDSHTLAEMRARMVRTAEWLREMAGAAESCLASLQAEEVAWKAQEEGREPGGHVLGEGGMGRGRGGEGEEEEQDEITAFAHHSYDGSSSHLFLPAHPTPPPHTGPGEGRPAGRGRNGGGKEGGGTGMGGAAPIALVLAGKGRRLAGLVAKARASGGGGRGGRPGEGDTGAHSAFFKSVKFPDLDRALDEGEQVAAKISEEAAWALTTVRVHNVVTDKVRGREGGREGGEGAATRGG
jgi:hypothetical protein